MKASEIRELPQSELQTLMAEHREELFNLRFQKVTGQLDNPHRVKQVKREIARMLTVLRERELAAEGEGEIVGTGIETDEPSDEDEVNE